MYSRAAQAARPSSRHQHPARCMPTIPARMTHTYSRHGTTSLVTVQVFRLYATERGSRPLIGVARTVSQSTPQCSSRRSQ